MTTMMDLRDQTSWSLESTKNTTPSHDIYAVSASVSRAKSLVVVGCIGTRVYVCYVRECEQEKGKVE